MTPTECQSCGRDDEPVSEVRRIYVTPASWETEATSKPAEGTEYWCDVCRVHYPHEAIG